MLCYLLGGYGLLYKKWIGRPIALSAGVIFQGTPPKIYIFEPQVMKVWLEDDFWSRISGRFGVNFFVGSSLIFQWVFLIVFCDVH